MEFKKLDISVFGVSADSEKSHCKFIERYDLPFSLISDTEKTLAQAFGAYGEKKLFGITYMGIIRSTFIIDEKGKILKVFHKVTPKGHAAEILESLA